AIPFALYGLWWLGYQETSFSRGALLLVPRFVFTAAAGALSALTGLASIDVSRDTGTYLDAGPTLLVIAIALAGWRLSRLGGVLVAAATVSNVGTLRDGAALLRSQAQFTETELGTLDMTRPVVAPRYASNGFIFFAHVTAEGYFAAERALGTPAATPSRIAA